MYYTIIDARLTNKTKVSSNWFTQLLVAFVPFVYRQMQNCKFWTGLTDRTYTKVSPKGNHDYFLYKRNEAMKLALQACDRCNEISLCNNILL